MARKIPQDPNIPLGTNKLASDTMFKERTLYTDVAYSHPHIQNGENFWYGNYGDNVPPGKVLYGRVDKAGYSVYPAEENLKQIPTPDGKTLFVLNFVADAFMDLQNYWTSRVVRDSEYSAANGPLKDIQAYEGWLSVHNLYHDFYTTNYNVFTNHKMFLTTERDEKIVDFDSFLSVFREFIEYQLPSRPFTRSGHIVSKFCAPQISGLMINIVPQADFGDDYAKYVGYFQNQNFRLYTDAARRFGFVVDVNAPWRLVADISSEPMKTYLRKYGVYNLDKVFKSYYIPTNRYDIEVFSVYMMNIYNSYVAASPNIRKKVPCKDGKTAWKLIARQPLTQERFEKDYPQSWWIRMYAWIRAKESELGWTQTKFEQMVKRAKMYEKKVNIEEAVKYINSHCIDNRRRIHGLPTLHDAEVKEIVKNRQLNPQIRPTFKF